jgi:hypothetical protein
MRVRSNASSYLFLVVAAVVTAPRASAQSSAVVRVTATDSSGAPISNAELTVTRGIRDIVAHGATDSAGHGLLVVGDLKDSTDLQVVMRKIGYPRGDRMFTVAPHDTAAVKIVVAQLRTTLAPVKINAAANLKWKSYHLDADDIANSDLPFTDAWDAVKRLRPDILRSRGGCRTGVREVWVNGKRIRLPLPPTGMALARARVGAPPDARFGYIPVSVLSDIAPEHIEEMMYHDCFDSSMAAVGSNDALFILLKPGVAFQENVGSFVVDAANEKPNEKPNNPR